MIKRYDFDYDFGEASVCLTVDTEKFLPEHAQELLSFFSWDYDKTADPVDEAMKKYAMRAIIIASSSGYNEYGVAMEFKELEGYLPVDGTSGITLVRVAEYEFDDEKLKVTITPNK